MSAPADEFKPTHSATVHAAVTCTECDLRAKWYLDAVEKGKEHHAQTGHELTGEIGYAVWIGETGREMNRTGDQRLRAAMGQDDVE